MAHPITKCGLVQAVRNKVIANLATSLEKAASELKKEGLTEGLPDTTDVARAVEQALHKQFSKHASEPKLHLLFMSQSMSIQLTH